MNAYEKIIQITDSTVLWLQQNMTFISMACLRMQPDALKREKM